ncbi:MAG TPA: hypothetical protein VJA86_03570 [Candidatus Nanoarchaeia archaeon]|nr:hypothetical protein [Candidatus Nanoarchaeia archaeon]
MHIELLKKIAEETMGKPAVDLIVILLKKKNINEFIIAKKLSLTINQTRNLLYKFSDRGIVSSTRKKDKKKGWYTYFWTFEIGRALLFMKQVLLKDTEHLKSILKSRENKRFYICKSCNIEMTEENALLTDFACRECGQLLELNADRKVIDDVNRKINKFAQQMKVVNEELERRGKEHEKERERGEIKSKKEKGDRLRKARMKRKRDKAKAEKGKHIKKEIEKGKKIKKRA